MGFYFPAERQVGKHGIVKHGLGMQHQRAGDLGEVEIIKELGQAPGRFGCLRLRGP